MKIISMAGNKGGVGKTTLALATACRLRELGHSVALLDLDPQASSSEWADGADVVDGTTFAVQSVVGARLVKTVDAASSAGVDYVIIDTAAKSESDSRIAFEASDLVLIISRPSILDIRGIRKTVEVVELARKRASTRVVINASPHPVHAADAEQAIQSTYDLPVSPVVVGHYVIHSHAMTSSSSVTALEPGGRAAEQIRALVDWIIASVSSPNKTNRKTGA